MTFRVTVPENTPAEDRVYMENFQPHGVEAHPMEKISSNTWTITLRLDEIETSGGLYTYRYTRNDGGDLTAEALETQVSATELGRSIPFRAGGVQNDVIKRWSWFPEGPVQKTSSLQPAYPFQQRVGGKEFRSGQVLQDLYLREAVPFYTPTARHMKEQGYTWVTIAPPWDFAQVDPLPRLSSGEELPNLPTYPSGGLEEHIEAFRKAGLRVHLAPQICCTEVDYRNRSAEWWDTYFGELERFLVYHATVARDTGADSLLFDTFAADRSGFSDTTDRLLGVLSRVREVFRGEVGGNVGLLYLEGSPLDTIKPMDPASVPWGTNLDFFVLGGDPPLSLGSSPSANELRKGAARILDAAFPLYERYKTPIVFQGAYASVAGSWRAAGFYTIDLMNMPWYGEEVWRESPHSFSGEDQARVVQAFFQAVAERPWVIGLSNFGYWHWEMPLSPDMSVRGKPAEDVWRKWNDLVYR